MLRNHDVIVRALRYHATPLDSQAEQKWYPLTQLASGNNGFVLFVNADSRCCVQLPLQLMVSRQIFNTLAPILVGLERTVDVRCIKLCMEADTFRFATRLVFDFHYRARIRCDVQAFLLRVMRKSDVLQHLTVNLDDFFTTMAVDQIFPELIHLRHLESFTTSAQLGSRHVEALLHHPNESIRTKSVRRVMSSVVHVPHCPNSLVEDALVPLIEGASNNGALLDYLYITWMFLWSERNKYVFSTPLRARLFNLALGLCQRSNDTQLRNTAALLLQQSLEVGSLLAKDAAPFWTLVDPGSVQATIHELLNLLVMSTVQRPPRNSFGYYGPPRRDDGVEFSVDIALALMKCLRSSSFFGDPFFGDRASPASVGLVWMSVRELFEVCLRNAERRHFMNHGSRGWRINCSREGLLWFISANCPVVIKESGLLQRAGEVLRDWHRGCLAHKLRLRRLVGNVDEEHLQNAAFAQHPPADSVFVAVRVLVASFPLSHDTLFHFDQNDSYNDRCIAPEQRLRIAEWLLSPDHVCEGALDLGPALRDFILGDNTKEHSDCVWDIAARVDSFLASLELIYRVFDISGTQGARDGSRRTRDDAEDRRKQQQAAVFRELFDVAVKGAHYSVWQRMQQGFAS